MKIRGQKVHTPIERIENQSIPEPNSGCWIWLGTVSRGYGRLFTGSRTNFTRKCSSAHRYSFETYRGAIADGLCVCHRCDNPSCVNPDHLFLGTYKDNSDDRDRKGRNIPAPRHRGENTPNAKLTQNQVDAIRASSVSSVKLAPEYGVSSGHIRALRRNEHFIPTPPALSQEERT